MHESPTRTTHCEFPRSLGIDVSSPFASCGPCRMEHEVLSFYSVSCLLDVRDELVVTSLKQKIHFVIQRDKRNF